MGIISTFLDRVVADRPDFGFADVALAADVLAYLHDAPANAAEDYRPGWDEPSYEPDPLDAAWDAGWRCGRDGLKAWYPKGPGWTREKDMRFLLGRHEGEKARELAERIELEEWFDSLERPEFEDGERGGGPIRDEDMWPMGCVS